MSVNGRLWRFRKMNGPLNPPKMTSSGRWIWKRFYRTTYPFTLMTEGETWEGNPETYADDLSRRWAKRETRAALKVRGAQSKAPWYTKWAFDHWLDGKWKAKKHDPSMEEQLDDLEVDEDELDCAVRASLHMATREEFACVSRGSWTCVGGCYTDEFFPEEDDLWTDDAQDFDEWEDILREWFGRKPTPVFKRLKVHYQLCQDVNGCYFKEVKHGS